MTFCPKQCVFSTVNVSGLGSETQVMVTRGIPRMTEEKPDGGDFKPRH